MVYGIFLFTSSCFFASLVTVLMKKAILMYHVSEVSSIFWKSLFSFLFALPFMIKRKFDFMKPNLLLINFNRNFLFLILTYFWYYGIILVPVSNASVFNQLTPIIVIFFAKILLKEKVSYRVWVALFVCIAASLMLLQQKESAQSIANKSKLLYYGYLCISISIIMKAAVSLYTKKLSALQDIFVTSHFYALFTFILSIPITFILEPKFLQHTNYAAMPYFALCGFLYILRTLTWAKALEYCTVSGMQPFDFSRIIFVSISSFFILNEKMEIRTMIIGVIIFASYMYLIKSIKKS